VTARDSLAKAVKAEGDASTAAQVRELRRPTVAAWLVNQLARQHAASIDELLETAQALRETQVAVLGGKADGARLQELSAVRRSQVDALVAAAAQIASEAGRKSAPLEAVDSTLIAATSDEDAGDAVRSGRLVKELSYSGFGLAEDLSEAVAPSLRVVKTPAKRGAAAKSGTKAQTEQAAKGVPVKAKSTSAEARKDAAIAEATDAVKSAQRGVQDALGEADDAQRAFEAAEVELESAQEEVERLTAALSQARSALVAAQRKHDKARGAAKIAHAEADRQRAALVKVESALGRLSED
jgi:hypothetical protein